MSVRQPVPMEQFSLYWQISMKFDISVLLQKSVEKIQVLLKSGKKYGYCTWRPIYTVDHILHISSENEKCFKQTLYKG